MKKYSRGEFLLMFFIAAGLAKSFGWFAPLAFGTVLVLTDWLTCQWLRKRKGV